MDNRMGTDGENLAYRTVLTGGTGEITEKKSRFIAKVQAAHTIEEAESFVDSVRKRYWDASHHCFAWILGRREEAVRSVDGGEPAGTAGRPILEVLQGEKLQDAVIVVTRYFGGTLLGTGGLARAYARAAKEGLSNSALVWMRGGVRLEIRTAYGVSGKVQYLLEKRGLRPEEIRYEEEVTFRVLLPLEEERSLREEVMQVTCAAVKFMETGRPYYVDKRR